MNPPLRAEADRAALIDALARRHDRLHRHRPRAARRDEKEAPFEEAPFGVIGLETAFAAVYTHLVAAGRAAAATVIARMSAGPARAFGLPAPALAEGRTADLALWDLDARVGCRAEPALASRATAPSPGGHCAGVAGSPSSGGRVAHRVIEAVA